LSFLSIGHITGAAYMQHRYYSKAEKTKD